ncbi:MAG: hypothetical protein RL095_1809 [Verrucomicrobiota bacterium]
MKRPFTLIELLLVVTVIAILLSLLLPALRGAREKSHLATCSSNLRQIGMALQNFSGDNQGNVPNKISGTMFSWVGKAGTNTTLSVTTRPLNAYLGYRTNGSEVPVARCTKDEKTGAGSYAGSGASYSSNTITTMTGGRTSLVTATGAGQSISGSAAPSQLISMAEYGTFDAGWNNRNYAAIAQWDLHEFKYSRFNCLYFDGRTEVTMIFASSNGTSQASWDYTYEYQGL